MIMGGMPATGRDRRGLHPMRARVVGPLAQQLLLRFRKGILRIMRMIFSRGWGL